MTARALGPDCAPCRERLHAYLDGELTGDEAAAVGEHLEHCSDCFDRSQLEEAFRRSIRATAGTAGRTATPELTARISRALDAEDERRAEIALADGRPRTPRTTGGSPWRTWSIRSLVAAASVLIAVATWATLNVPRVPAAGSGAAVLHPAFIQGHLVCLDCEILRMEVPASGLNPHLPEATVPSSDPGEHHRLHLRSDSGRLWELFAEAAAAPPLELHDNAGRPASVVGTAYPTIGVLRVARLSFD